MPFCTNKQWENRAGGTETIDRVDGAPTAVVGGCFGVPIVKRWIDGSTPDVTTLDNGKRFVLDAKTLLRWEHTEDVGKLYAGFPNEAGGGFKETIQLDGVPSAARWRFRLTFPAGVRFSYQPALTQEEIDEGAQRPDWCVGSFAVSDQWGCKVGHIPRPLAVDGDGKKRWFDLSLVDGWDLIITGDADWLKTAKYPVMIDPTFGYTTIGGSHITPGKNFCRANGPHIAPENGSVTDIVFYGQNSSSLVTQGLYDATGAGGKPNNLLGVTAGSTMPATYAWKQQALGSAAPVTAATAYWHGHSHGVTICDAKYDSDASYRRCSETYTYSAGSLKDPYGYTWTGGGFYKLSHYATYTVAAAHRKAYIIGGGILGCAV